MASPKRQSTRKSIAHAPSADAGPATADKENHTADLNALATLKAAAQADSQRSERKTRSKSLGPGGLDALKDGSHNRRKTAAPPPRSILKPSIPLSPLKEIPSRGQSAGESSPAAATGKQVQPTPSNNTTTLNSPRRSPARTPHSPTKASPTKTSGVSSPQATKTIRQDEHASNDARETRCKEREAIQQQREARRKSMANRRVSFAPEATLHTWDHIEDIQDSTTSSASTDATRRASSATDMADDPPSTPSEEPEPQDAQDSPAHQRDLNQKQRRRKSSGIPPMNFNNPLDMTSSPYTTAASITVGHQPSSESPSSASPERHTTGSGTTIQPSQPMPDADVDENGEMTMEMADDEVTAAFKPWAQQVQPQQLHSNSAKLAVNADQENINPFSPAFQRGAPFPQSPMPSNASEDDNADMSMDITHAVGRIMPSQTRQSMGKAQSTSRRRSVMPTHNSSSDSNSVYGDNTMDFTNVVGGIQFNAIGSGPTNTVSVDQNEELSMEFTSVFGGIQSMNRRKSQPQTEEAQSYLSVDQQQQHISNSQLDADGDTEMTMDFDDIVSNEGGDNIPAEQAQAAGAANETQAVLKGNMQPDENADTSVSATANQLALPQVDFLRNIHSPSKTEGANTTPSKSPQTPSKQLTPQPDRPTTPNKTSTPRNVSMRTPSPRKLFRNEIKLANQSPKDSAAAFSTTAGPSQASPLDVSVAAKINAARRISGVGFDKQGLGSPRIASLLDRRASIGDEADVFAPQSLESRGVHFEDPRVLNAEVSKDREENERRESGQFILEKEAGADIEEKDTTLSLKEAIGSMTPKKNKFKGRKSLATGSAKGILGKRPAELDEEEDEGTPQGLKGRQASPVKKIKLQAPPSASETTGRSLMARRSLGPAAGISRPFTPVSGSPVKKGAATTPSHKGHFKDADALPGAQMPLPILGDAATAGPPAEQDQAEERMHLQEFLNLTNIRFMELNTTKRRHTTVNHTDQTLKDPTGEIDQDPSKLFADAVVAGACTLPMLELYQHSCRELKKYISEGRKIVRQIEENTYEENPALFREYTSASPKERAVMDNQFKNMKTHARLLSKGMWYEWRMKLLDGLKEGLVLEAGGLDRDKTQLDEQEAAIEEVLPSLLEEHKRLEQECSSLRARANELANCDQDELRDARQQILSVDEQIRLRRQQIEKLQTRSIEMDNAIEDATDARADTVEAIKEAQKMLNEYRGWSAAEVNKLKANVDALEKESGWSIASSSSTQLTMIYRGQLQLSFDTAAFQPAAESSEKQVDGNAPIRLLYIADQNKKQPLQLTTEKRFFLQLLQACLQGLEQNKIHVKDLLYFISAGWTQALALSEEIRRLELENITVCDIVSDERLTVRATMLLPKVETKVNIFFDVGAAIMNMNMSMKLKTRAEVVYGEQYREEKMREFLKSKIGDAVGGDMSEGSWADAFRELKKKLIARGRK